LKQFRLLLQLYRRPLATFSKVIDEGRLPFAVIAALAVVLLLQVPRNIELSRTLTWAQAYVAAHQEEIAAHNAQAAKADAGPKADDPQGESQDDADVEDEPWHPPTVSWAVDLFTAYAPAYAPQHYLPGLAALALCFVPLAILLITLWDSLGGFATILFRDYLTLLVCVLLAWTAAYLPLALARAALVALHAPASAHPVFWWASNLYFVVLSVCAIRTVFGTGFGHAAGAAAAAWAGSIGGLCLYSIVGSGLSWLGSSFWFISPCMLYYLYTAFQARFRSFDLSFRSRQRLKKYLEDLTINPSDADAHYQLGLIYQQRCQPAPAMERFKKAVEIDPAAADAHYQLGRIARQMGHYEQAMDHLRTAAHCDDKCSLSEVWREMGVVNLLSQRFNQAREVLSKYLDRRPYDPEGLCWYGRTLLKLGLQEPARLAFTEAIESVKTMPPGRKRQVSTWGSQASKELRAMPSAPQPHRLLTRAAPSEPRP
jgi:tetratricopeptide (TPR) repeat protein